MITFTDFVTEATRLPNGLVIQNKDLVTPKNRFRFTKDQLKSQAAIYAHWKKLKDTKGKEYADRWLTHVSGPSTTTRPDFVYGERQADAETAASKVRSTPQNKAHTKRDRRPYVLDPKSVDWSKAKRKSRRRADLHAETVSFRSYLTEDPLTIGFAAITGTALLTMGTLNALVDKWETERERATNDKYREYAAQQVKKYKERLRRVLKKKGMRPPARKPRTKQPSVKKPTPAPSKDRTRKPVRTPRLTNADSAT